MDENNYLYVGFAIATIICLIFCYILINVYKYNSTPTTISTPTSTNSLINGYTQTEIETEINLRINEISLLPTNLALKDQNLEYIKKLYMSEYTQLKEYQDKELNNLNNLNKLSYVLTSVNPIIINNKYIYYFKKSDTISFSKPTIISVIIISGGISNIPIDLTNNTIYSESLHKYSIYPSLSLKFFYSINPNTYNVTVGTPGELSKFDDIISKPPVRTIAGVSLYFLDEINPEMEEVITIPKNTVYTSHSKNGTVYEDINHSILPALPHSQPKFKVKQSTLIPIDNLKNYTLRTKLDNAQEYKLLLRLNNNISISNKLIQYNNSEGLTVHIKSKLLNAGFLIIVNDELVNLLPGYDGSEFNNGCVIIIIDPLLN
jgi:hypothetical protein